MVLESLKIRWLEHRPYISLFFGFFYTFVGFLVAMLFFPGKVSVAMLFLTTLLLVPTLIKLVNIEETRESKDGFRRFITDHIDIIEIFIFMFIGVFLGYVVLGYFDAPDFDRIFDYQIEFLKQREGLSSDLIENFLQSDLQPSLGHASAIIQNNLKVTGIFFLLSILYGAGAVFLVTLNASVFAVFIFYVANYLGKTISQFLLALGMFMIHLVPEIGGFLVAAIAGGVLSKAIIKEKFRSRRFKNVLRDSIMLLALAAALIIIGAFLEVYVTATLFHKVF